MAVIVRSVLSVCEWKSGVSACVIGGEDRKKEANEG
jgi:hypothetical protein